MKIKLTIVLLALFGLTTLSDAQVSKSGREKGFVIRPELVVGNGPLMGVDSHCSTKYLQGAFVYQFNPYIDMGIGAGYCRNHWAYLGKGTDNIYLVPAYLCSRAYLCNRKISPYIDLKLGYNISNNEGCVVSAMCVFTSDAANYYELSSHGHFVNLSYIDVQDNSYTDIGFNDHPANNYMPKYNLDSSFGFNLKGYKTINYYNGNSIQVLESIRFIKIKLIP